MRCEPDNLLQEVAGARTARDAHLSSWDEMVRRYHQQDYKGFEECDFAPENHEGEYVALMLPKIALTEPRVRVKCRKKGMGRMEAIALRYALNQWAEETSLGEVMQEVVRDFLFNFGVYYTTQEPMPGYHGGNPSRPHWPRVQRLSQRQFLLDPLCGVFRCARFAGHEYAVGKEELIDMATQRPELGWNIPLLQETDTTQDFEWRQSNDSTPDREELRVIRLWVPGKYEPGFPGPEQGCSGTIYTLIDGQDGNDWVREPIPAYGPRWGNYALAGAYGVPDSPWPLGPLTMHKGRADELNAHSVAASKAMAEYKRLVLVSASNPQLAQMLKRPDMFVIPVKGLNPNDIVQVEMGGLTPEHMNALSMLRDRLDRTAGMSEAKRGNVAGGTATENAIADEAGAVRTAYIKQRHTQAAEQVFSTAGWYIMHDERAVFPLDDEASREMGVAGQAWYVGGAGDPNSEIAREMGFVDPDDMRFQIEPYSGDYIGQGVAKQQFMEALKTALEMAQAMPTMPHVRWKDLFTKLGDVTNDEDWADMVEPDVAAMMAGMPGAMPGTPQPQMQSMAGPGGGGGGMGGMGGGMPGRAAGPGGDQRMHMAAASRPGRMSGRAAAGGRALK